VTKSDSSSGLTSASQKRNQRHSMRCNNFVNSRCIFKNGIHTVHVVVEAVRELLAVHGDKAFAKHFIVIICSLEHL